MFFTSSYIEKEKFDKNKRKSTKSTEEINMENEKEKELLEKAKNK